MATPPPIPPAPPLAPSVPIPQQPFQVDNIADVWTVLTALGTVGAAVATAVAVWVAVVTYRRQVNNERREHASKVTVYTDLDGNVTVENLGDLPVYAVALSDGRPRQEVRVLGFKARLPKDDHITVFVPVETVVEPAYRAWAVFTDSNGLRWIRYLNGDIKHEGQKS